MWILADRVWRSKAVPKISALDTELYPQFLRRPGIQPARQHVVLLIKDPSGSPTTIRPILQEARLFVSILKHDDKKTGFFFLLSHIDS